MQGQASHLPPNEHRYLDVIGVAKSFKGAAIMDQMNFRVAKGELVSLLGPSGCGKTTLLRIIAGLLQADTGDIVLGGRNLSSLPAHKRNISVVFQNYALFPHLTVAENVAFGLRARGTSKADAARPVADALALVRMDAFADRPVSALSGGQQQRVAVARALVVSPDLLLLDEPFSALDRKLRETMQIELKALLRNRGITAIFVTHDQDEAMGVSDRIAVMNKGKIEQFAEPSTLYAQPASPFVMDFVGLSTRLSGRVTEQAGGIATVTTNVGPVRARSGLAAGTPVLLGVRPELITPDPTAEMNQISVQLDDVMTLGSKTVLHGATTDDDNFLCELSGIRTDYKRGQTVTWGWAVDDTLIHAVPA
ncbi:ABC transporter ATP-binding protein [Yoonia sediminilitoris]|uniref:Putative spermidine/putrescine transport system ATP-binding protein n=1 Tax=Yoonia sediminilitoris TaxID=1286148 RepID=A0A2T6KML6_9RHOB|nr:ABC transporter ATP-binding protein [Yoonia sediminilitoris]PUB17460.1 putative spermidine/putrescine transport system ATP-binding protein [Yoonia sediminilitoris]RCW97755.1 putative spermidine/putrescine transport system ATP-binding protein [Yoonia sediminilitoris]